MTELTQISDSETGDFLITKEYRRFVEFCNACQSERYIGLCYGPPGVGKTVSARQHAKWHLLENRLPADRSYLPLPKEIVECQTLFYTPEISNSAKRILDEISTMRTMLGRFVEEASSTSGDQLSRNGPADYCKLLLIDEADRLKMSSLEQLRDLYDRADIGLVLIGMPGLEKRMSRYPQLYSRVGFAHEFRALSAEEMQFILKHHWQKCGLSLQLTDFTDTEAMAAIIRITGGNFRLVQRLFTQIERVLKINRMRSITKEVVETARECLVIGTN